MSLPREEETEGAEATRGIEEGKLTLADVAALFPISILILIAFGFWEYHVQRNSRPPLIRLALFTRAKGRLAAMYLVGFIAMAGFVSIGFNATLFYQVRLFTSAG